MDACGASPGVVLAVGVGNASAERCPKLPSASARGLPPESERVEVDRSAPRCDRVRAPAVAGDVFGRRIGLSSDPLLSMRRTTFMHSATSGSRFLKPAFRKYGLFKAYLCGHARVQRAPLGM